MDTHSVGVVVGRPESFSVLGVVTSGETVLTSVVQVGDTIGDEWVSVGIVDLLKISIQSLGREEQHTDRSVTMDSNRGLSWLLRKEPYSEGSDEFPATCLTICETSSRLPTELLKARVKG